MTSWSCDELTGSHSAKYFTHNAKYKYPVILSWHVLDKAIVTHDRTSKVIYLVQPHRQTMQPARPMAQLTSP